MKASTAIRNRFQVATGHLLNMDIPDPRTLLAQPERFVVKTEPKECPVGPEEAAAFLKVARSTVMSLARTGRIPAHPVTNGSRKRWLFFLSELESHVRALGVNCGSHPCAL